MEYGLSKQNLGNSLMPIYRKQLKKLVGITYPRVISNKTLYEKTKITPISQHAAKLRWSLLGHILRSNKNLPARKAMEIYLKNIETKYPGFRRRLRIILSTVLSKDLKRAETIASRENLKIALKLSSIDDLTELRKIAEDRKQWKLLVGTINLNYFFQQ